MKAIDYSYGKKKKGLVYLYILFPTFMKFAYFSDNIFIETNNSKKMFYAICFTIRL